MLSENGQAMLEDMPDYAQSDPTLQALFNAVGNELDRLEQYLTELRDTLAPALASGELLTYWERFLGLPENLDASTEDRIDLVLAAIRKRSAAPGTGWNALLNVILRGALWRATENTDASGDYTEYGLRIYDLELAGTDYRVGAFDEMVRQITPAHLQITAITRSGDDTFRVGISEVGDPI